MQNAKCKVKNEKVGNGETVKGRNGELGKERKGLKVE